MNLKTFTASTIQEALATARSKLGDDVILLQSEAASREQPARITVMADDHSRTRGSSKGRQRSSQKPRTLTEETAQPREAFSRNKQPASQTRRQQRYQSIQNLIEQTGSGDGAAGPPPSENGSSSQARERFFPKSGNGTDTPDARSRDAQTNHLLEKQLTLLHERLDKLERRLGEALVGTAQRWAAHPLFSDLLNKGLRPSTVSQLFDGLAKAGYEPDQTDHETLRWHLAQELRRKIDIPNSTNNSSPLLFVGPTGAGKTSLILKLIKNQRFFGRRSTTVISLVPEDTDELLYQDPLELYQRYGVTVQTVRKPEEMHRALERVAHFDQVLIDAPPIPLQPPAARRSLQQIRRLVAPVVPLETHLVMNTLRAFDGFDLQSLEQLPLSFDCVALTHLDESSQWGRAAEWITALSLPMRFVSTSRQVPEGVQSFSPSWFIEQMMELK